MASSRVKSAERVMDVLDLLAEVGSPVPTMEIARRLELPRSTTYHLLNVMLERRYVSYSGESRSWSLGIATLEVGSSFSRTGALQRLAQPYLGELSRRLGLTAHLAVLQGTDVLYLDKREPSSSGIRLVTEVGTRLPAHLTAIGHAALSTLPDEELQRLYDGYDWPRRTDAGPGTFAELLSYLGVARERGVAVEIGFTTSGVECVAGPIRVRSDYAAAAIGVTLLQDTSGSSDDVISRTVAEVAGEFAATLR